MKKNLLFLLMFLSLCASAQQDSIYYSLPAVEIKPVSQEAALRLLSSENILEQQELKKQASYSILSALNTVPGLRMEERSPGSYRLSLRGSLLRSPFGVRDVKIYLGDFPFTDAGGNTYLGSLDISNLNSIRILKGPEASIFGANTGGVLLIDPVYKTPDSLKLTATLSGGSYGLFHEDVLFQIREKNSVFTLNQAYQHSDGYRQNSAMQRHYVQTSEIWNYTSKTQLKVLLLFSDLYYQTPGGLTLKQFNESPSDARHATATLPGAVEQKAAIYNKTAFGGISNTYNITDHVRHVVSVFGSYTDFKNPFITNYEQRREATLGVRTYFDITFLNREHFSLKWNIGGEAQQTNSDISNFDNDAGVKAAMQAHDLLNAQQAFAFTRLLADVDQRLLLEASLSYNFFSYRYKNIFPANETSFGQRNFTPQLMPHFAASYKITNCFSWRAAASAGYSAPTIAEVRSSDNIVNTNLQAEKGQNYETGFRLRDKKDFIWIDASVFYFNLKNAIVRRTDENGNEYFVNAGGTSQPGLEAQMNLWIIKPNTDVFVRALQIKGNITYNQFTFSNYVVNNTDYSGNKLTGVPDYTSAESIYLEIPGHISMYAQYYYSSAIPLNDAGTESAKEYHLLQIKTEWYILFQRFKLSVFAGVDNLLDQKYSLGNDLNAAGNRYYNAAAPRNYYAGVKGEF
ncbi:MAG: TonB-dependent receptor [Bacteroidetes bacterium]|nr:TonB-dependent receptor [Bacteroidota bacterium]